jgi:hypothetical protein
MAKKQVLLLGFALASSGFVQGQNAIGEVLAGDASVRGTLILSAQGTQVLSGSQVAAGDGAALLKLKRGGQVRICPKTNLSVSADASGKMLALGLSVGSMELNYTLAGAADLLMTPDFRVQLISPGTFHLAITVGPSGDTCMRTLPGNNASVFVSEMLGDNSYQLSSGKSVLFAGGKISGAITAPEACGCPESNRDMLTAESAGPTSGSAAGSSADPSAPVAVAAQPAAQPMEKQIAETPPATAQPAAAHLEVGSRFVYRGDDAAQSFYSSVSGLSLSTDNSQLALALLPQVSGPPAPAQVTEEKAGFLHRLGKALGHLFGR